MYTTKAIAAEAPLRAFIETYQDKEKFMAYCKECPNYAARWSCPPLAFDPADYIKRFARIDLIGVQIRYDEETVRAADTPEKAREIGTRAIRKVKTQIADLLLGAETRLKNAASLSSGGCRICPVCARVENKPCRHPEKMRHSLDAFGFDLTKITREFLGVELKWSNGGLPEYHTLIHALLRGGSADGETAQILGEIKTRLTNEA